MTASAAAVAACPSAPSADGLLRGRVHSWDMSSGVDGPGTRFVVFLAGCPLRCLYCHNPDTWNQRHGADTPVGELAARMRRLRRFLGVSGGGVTVSGGEPLQQPAFTQALLEAAKREGLHTALDTSGFLGARASDELLDATDLVLLDVKAGDNDTHHLLTGQPLENTIAFARRLAHRATPIWLRYVVVPGLTDDAYQVARVAQLARELRSLRRVDVIGFHKLGQPKYEALGLEFPLDDVPAPAPDQVATVRAAFAERGLPVDG